MPQPIYNQDSVLSTIKLIDEALANLNRIRFALEAARGEIRALSGRYVADKEGF